MNVLMSVGRSIRMSLVARGLSHEDFAMRCGVDVLELKAMLSSGEVSEGVLNEHASMMDGNVATRSVYEALDRGVLVERLGGGACVFGRPVRNDVLQVVVFSDGREGMVRKKRGFKPRQGLPCEVETSDEEGFLNLVGKYRDNGVRTS